MIDTILIIVGFLSMLSAVIGYLYLNKNSEGNFDIESDKISLLREEKLYSKKKSHRRKKSPVKEIKELEIFDQEVLYQTAREKRISVGELLLAARIHSLK